MTILFVLGTRPEAIKLAPLILYYRKNFPKVKTVVCITAQHREMLDDVLRFFTIDVDFDLNLMRPNQQLSELTASIIQHLQHVISDVTPTVMIVQGDTTTAMAGALTGFYNKIPVAHVEAGLRSFNKREPFPEEVNRKIISQIADFHFAPTSGAAANLAEEKVNGHIYTTGNTVIDALLEGVKIIENENERYEQLFSYISKYSKCILVTVHRRENFGKPLNAICKTIIDIRRKNPDVCFVLPVHPNPNVKEVIYKHLGTEKGVYLINPLPYDQLIWLLRNSYFVLTDSGGIQEEAPSLGKPVIVMRNVTERTEGVEAGNAILAGNNHNTLFTSIELLLNDDVCYYKMANTANPYGDGTSSQKIAEVLNSQVLYK